MKLQRTIHLSDVYNREEDFSENLADNLDALNIGEFEDVETEFNVNRRRADIVATGVNGVLVVENQFGKADWDHWGRLEAYARAGDDTTVAVLVAESFEDLMIVTCNRRNEESNIAWYLIQAQVNEHEEHSFHHVARPARDISIGPAPDVEYSEFWEPIRNGEYGDLFAGKPVPIQNEDWISRSIRSIDVCLYLNKRNCYIQVYFRGANPTERRHKVITLFPESDYDYEYRDSPKETKVKFPVLYKGKDDRDDWDEIREKLVAMGTNIYNKINESEL